MRHYNGYGVLYKVAGESDWDRGTRTGFDTGDVTLSVKPFTNYSVRVFVRSNKGDAVIGPAHNVTTPEGGTWRAHIFGRFSTESRSVALSLAGENWEEKDFAGGW